MSYSLGHVQELVQVHSSVGELPEGTLLLLLGVRLKINKHRDGKTGQNYSTHATDQ